MFMLSFHIFSLSYTFSFSFNIVRAYVLESLSESVFHVELLFEKFVSFFVEREQK